MKTNLNYPVGRLESKDLEKIRMVCFDSDGVTAEKGTEFQQNEKGMVVVANQLSADMEAKLRKLNKHFWVNITSGRSLDFLKYRYRHVISDRFSLQGEIGNAGWWPEGSFVEEWDSYEIETMGRLRSKLEVRMKDEENFKGFEPKDLIITVHALAEIPAIEKLVKEEDRDEKLYCWWNGEAYDIGPRRFNKGTGLMRMCQAVGMDLGQVMTVGNGVNDENMKDVVGLDVSTDPASLSADFVIKGEHAGGMVLIEKILDLVEDKSQSL